MILNGRLDEVVTVHTDKKNKRKSKEECRFFRRRRTKFTEFRFSRGDGYTIKILFRSVICLATNPARYTWVYQKVPRLSSTDRKQMALGEYLRYD